MAFVDEITINVVAGAGGNGVVRWRHEKGREFGGPAGGDGGKGGDVYALAVRDIHLLSKYRTKKEFRADDGGDGGNNSLHGADGKDLDILLPVGSIITNTKTGEKFTFQKEGDRALILEGGKGGRGNKSYKSSTNRSPKQSTPGMAGGKADFFIEVELIADIGFIGLPNAGKTSLLNTLTHAKGKIGAYPFTTLEPNLGEFYGYIISDIPGLIEGAAKGKGLGHKFLRHVRRTKILVHLISLENENLVGVYRIVRKELKNFDPKLLEKKEIVFLTKTDVLEDEKKLASAVKKMKKANPAVYAMSLYDDTTIKKVQDLLVKMLAK